MPLNAAETKGNTKRKQVDEEETTKRTKADEGNQLLAECMPGIEVVVAKAGAAAMQLAFKAQMPATRQSTQVRDVICCLDNTCSMASFGADQGLLSTVHNLGSLVDMCLKDAFGSTDEGKRAQDTARATTFLHAFRFGTGCELLHGDGFFPLTRDAIAENVPKLAEGMSFSDTSTNIEQAILHAGKVANRRLEDMRTHDIANGIDRCVSLVLLTDGSPTEGSRYPEHILYNLDLEVDRTFPIYGIGLGTNTHPIFLSQICRNGFWKHVENPAEPKEAFDATLGYIFKAVGECEIYLRVCLYRDGKAVPGAHNDLTTKHSFGLVTADKCRARVLRDLALPLDAKHGDALIVDYKFSLASEWSVTKIEMHAHDQFDPPICRNMVRGLMKEAEDIESMMDRMRTNITRGATVDDASQELMTTFRSSSAVQSQIKRVAEICEQSLSCPSYASSVGTFRHCPQIPGLVHSAPVEASELPQLEPNYSVFEAESSFSQF